MKYQIPVTHHGEISMDVRVRYMNSIKGFENEKRLLKMTDKEEAEYQKKRLELKKQLQALNRQKGYL